MADDRPQIAGVDWAKHDAGQQPVVPTHTPYGIKDLCAYHGAITKSQEDFAGQAFGDILGEDAGQYAELGHPHLGRCEDCARMVRRRPSGGPSTDEERGPTARSMPDPGEDARRNLRRLYEEQEKRRRSWTPDNTRSLTPVMPSMSARIDPDSTYVIHGADSYDGPDDGGDYRAEKHRLELREKGLKGRHLGTVEYFEPEGDAPLRVHWLEADHQHQGQGVASHLMDELQRRYPGAPIDHGERTLKGQGWWDRYSGGRETNGRTMATHIAAMSDEERREQLRQMREQRKQRRGPAPRWENGKLVQPKFQQDLFSQFARPDTPEERAEAERQRQARVPKPEPIDDREYSLDDVSRHYDWEGFDPYEISHLVQHPEHATFTHENVPVHSLRLVDEHGNPAPVMSYSEIADQGEDEQERLHGLEHAEQVPPIVVVRHGEHHIIADGSHRAAIAAQRGDSHIPAFVTERTILPKTSVRKTAHSPSADRVTEHKKLTDPDDTYWHMVDEHGWPERSLEDEDDDSIMKLHHDEHHDQPVSMEHHHGEIDPENHWCPVHQEYHDDPNDVEEHEAHEDDLREMDMDHLPDTLHRGMDIELPKQLHDYVHDKTQPQHERAHALLNHVRNGAGGGGLGMHWTTDDETAKEFAGQFQYYRDPTRKPRTRVVLEADTPDAQHHVPQDDLSHGSYWYDPTGGEREIPIKPGAPVNVRSISWAHGGGPYTHHEFDQPQRHIAARAFDAYDPNQVYLRFGQWPKDERSRNNITGWKEEGVSVYDLDHHGEPEDPDPNFGRIHRHDEYCEPDCNLDEDEEYSGLNDTREEMEGRVRRAERNRFNGHDIPGETGHLVKGDMVGVGHDGEPVLNNVRRVGDWIDHRHLFVPGAPKHRLARDPDDEDYEPPPKRPQKTAAKYPWTHERYTPTGYETVHDELEGPLYHGSRSKRLKEGDLITPGRKTNPWGDEGPKSQYVHFTTDHDAARDYADMAGGHVYEVEPTGEFRQGYNGGEFKSSEPLRVVRKVEQPPKTAGRMDPGITYEGKIRNRLNVGKGRPMDEWYHGTTANFDRFAEPGTIGKTIHWNTSLGPHFTENEKTAAMFGQTEEGAPGRIIHAELHMRNPKVFAHEHDMDKAAFDHEYDQGTFANSKNQEMLATIRRERKPNMFTGNHMMAVMSNHPDAVGIGTRFKQRLKDAGYDGIVYNKNAIEGGQGRAVIAFHPDQIDIKSAHPYDPGAKRTSGDPYQCRSGQKTAAYTPMYHGRAYEDYHDDTDAEGLPLIHPSKVAGESELHAHPDRAVAWWHALEDWRKGNGDWPRIYEVKPTGPVEPTSGGGWKTKHPIAARELEHDQDRGEIVHHEDETPEYVMYHGTTHHHEGDDPDADYEPLDEIRPHGSGASFGGATGDPDYAYANPRPEVAWRYAEKRAENVGGVPHVYRVTPKRPETVEEDPHYDQGGYNRGNYLGDVRTKHGFHVLDEVPMSNAMRKEYGPDHEDEYEDDEDWAHEAVRKTAVLANPSDDEHPQEWFHGSPWHFSEFVDPADVHPLSYGDDPDDDSHWNSLLGTHFTPNHETAEKFSNGTHSQAAMREDEEPSGHVIHARLHITNPKHYASEYDMDQEAYERERAAGNHIDKYLSGEPEDDQEDYPHAHKYAGDSERHYSRDDQDHGAYADRREPTPAATGWLNSHPDKFEIANRFKKRLIAQGHDGVVYGNEFENAGFGSHGARNQSAIAFHPHQIEITQHHFGDACKTPEEERYYRSGRPGTGQMEIPGTEHMGARMHENGTGRLATGLPPEAWDRYHEQLGEHPGEDKIRLGMLSTAGPRQGVHKVAHDSGDNQRIFHCPFCGSGRVIGRSDGTAECAFCNQAFTVQVQPQYGDMPQTINGMPVQIPGMPGEPQPFEPGQEAGPPPPGASDGGDGGMPPEIGDAEDGDEDEGGDDSAPPFQTSSVYRTAAGDLLPERSYVRHLALASVPPEQREAVLAALRHVG